jgi:hypothetical protein
MTFHESTPTRSGTPAKVVIALVLLWPMGVGILLLALRSWADLGGMRTPGDFFYYYPAQAFLVPLIGAALVYSAIGLHRRNNAARVTAVVLSAVFTVGSLSSLALGFVGVIALAWCGLTFAMLISGDAKEWCGRPPRRRRAA